MKFFKVVAILALAAIAAIAFAWHKWSNGCVSQSSTPQVEFNSENWKKNEDSRARMLGDLLDRSLLVGRTSSEIVALLGASDSASSEQIAFIVATYTNERACGLHRHAILKIYLGADEKTKSAVLVQD